MGIGHRLRKSANNGSGGFRALVDGEVHVNGKGDYVKVPYSAVGSPLLRALAARTWVDVTKGAGVVLADGKEVKPAK